MSVADLVALALSTTMPRRVKGRKARETAWREKNRAYLREYKRAWRAMQREKYGTTT